MVISAIGEAQHMLTHLQPRKIILDTDIGDDIDDAFALLLMFESHAFDILGVTTVFRNTEKRAKMAKQLIRSLGYDKEVYAGCNFPLVGKIDDLIHPDIRKKETLDENGLYLIPQWEESMREETIGEQNAVDFIIEQVHKYPHEVTIVLIGPYTNIATAMKKDPSIIPLIKEVRVMGGAFDMDWIEWNVFCDPEAAHILFHSGVDLYAVGFNVTRLTGLSNEQVQSLKTTQSPTLKLVYKAMQKWFAHYEFAVPVMHDPLTIASILDDSIVKFENHKIEVDLHSRGKTIENDTGAMIHSSVGVDKDKFFKLFQEILHV